MQGVRGGGVGISKAGEREISGARSKCRRCAPLRVSGIKLRAHLCGMGSIPSFLKLMCPLGRGPRISQAERSDWHFVSIRMALGAQSSGQQQTWPHIAQPERKHLLSMPKKGGKTKLTTD